MYEEDTRIERLFRQLHDLEPGPSLTPSLAEILRLFADATHCELVYLEIAARDDMPEYSLGHATYTLPPGRLRARISRALFRQALFERATVAATLPAPATGWRPAPLALATPIGRVIPRGVLYVESAVPLTPFERERLEWIARHLYRVWPWVSRVRQPLMAELRALKELRICDAIERHETIAEVARVLGISRTLIYRVLEDGVAGRDRITGQLYSNDTEAPDMERDATQIVSSP